MRQAEAWVATRTMPLPLSWSVGSAVGADGIGGGGNGDISVVAFGGTVDGFRGGIGYGYDSGLRDSINGGIGDDIHYLTWHQWWEDL